MSVQLPDAEELVIALAEQMRPHMTASTGLVGIVTGGVWVAERLHAALDLKVPLGVLDVSFYRDDFQDRGLKRTIEPSTIPFEVEERNLILVDDVLYTGRTIRAAMNEVFDYGRPTTVRLATLIDRGGRELPIAPQFVGATLELPPDTSIELRKTAAGRLELALEKS